MKLGTIQLRPGAALAPMAGFTDAAQRRMAARFGASFTVSEMVSAKALTLGDKKSPKLIENGENCAPYGVQLFGAEPETMAEAARLIAGYKFDFYDINMGCPAPKITGSGAGSALMKNPALAGDIAAAVVGNVTTKDGTRTRAIATPARRRPYGRTTRLAPVRRCAITYMLVTSPTARVSAMP